MYKCLIFCAAFCQFFVASFADAANRTALVIGNGRYTNVEKLKNPPNDARAMATTLRKLGFEVSEGIDLKRQEMERMVTDFLTNAAGARLALFFYAGHGVQVDGKNYLIPVDAAIKERDDLLKNVVELDRILDGVSDAARTSILILDACRDDPFSTKSSKYSSNPAFAMRGLASYSTIGRGSLVAYSTAPDQVALDGQGANSPFTAALLKYLPSPSLEVRQVLTRVRSEVAAETQNKQIPWDNSSLMNDIYMGKSAETLRPISSPTATSPVDASDRSSPLEEDCVTINLATTRAEYVRTSWKLVDGNRWILDFKDKGDQAKQAERIVKFYNLNRYCFVRRQSPSFIYWLAGDQSAAGSMPNEDCLKFNPDNIAARQIRGSWKVVDGNHAMFDLPVQADAERAVQMIRHYRFDRTCFVGRPGATMSYLRK